MAAIERKSGSATVTLGAGDGTASSDFVISGYSFGRIELPSAMTGSNLVIESYNAGGNWVDCCEDGVQLSIPFTASSSERIPDSAFGAYKLRFKSDGVEAAARTFCVHLSG